MEGYNIRFRHVGGDFGPYVFPKTCTVLNLKEKIIHEWPKVNRGGGGGDNNNSKEGDGSATTTGSPQGVGTTGGTSSGTAVVPRTAQELRIIFGGRMLDDQKLVKELHHSMGNPQGQKMVTMHVVVRQPNEDKARASGGKRKGKKACCVVM
mmetsp:Transcript_37280/g.80558  ORF Transcript_37280/g.80558 Transcript_37280/m.80558 type:complete len:151 (+) Transcript_37280:1-453(+)